MYEIVVDEETTEVGQQVQQVVCNQKHMTVSLSKRFQACSYLTYYIVFSNWSRYTPTDTSISIHANIYK